MSDPVMSLVTEDLNRDGLLDVITTGSNGSGNSISVRLGTRTIITGIETPPMERGVDARAEPAGPVQPGHENPLRARPLRPGAARGLRRAGDVS